MADDDAPRRSTRTSARVAAGGGGAGGDAPPPAPAPHTIDDPASLDAREAALASKLASFTAPKALLDEVPEAEAGDDQVSVGEREGGALRACPCGGWPALSQPHQPLTFSLTPTPHTQPTLGRAGVIADREDDYKRRRLGRALSPARVDAFAPPPPPAAAAPKGKKGKAKAAAAAEAAAAEEPRSSYADVMREAALARERDNTLANIRAKARAEEDAAAAAAAKRAAAASWDGAAPGAKKARGWDGMDEGDAGAPGPSGAPSKWDETPLHPSAGGAGVGGAAAPGDTPLWGAVADADGAKATAAAAAARPRSRWDATPAIMAGGAGVGGGGGGAPDATPLIVGGGGGGAPTTAYAGAPPPGATPLTLTAEQYASLKADRALEERNRPLSDGDLDAMLPAAGYEILTPPPDYAPARRSGALEPASATPAGDFYVMPEAGTTGGASAAAGAAYGIAVAPPGGLPELKPEDHQFFGALLTDVDEAALSPAEARDRRISKLLLKVKNGNPQQRKSGMRALTDRAREFGTGPLFDQVLPLLMAPTLEDAERHVLVKVVDRVLARLEELVRPYVHKVLVVIEPLLIDEDYYARVEGRELVANLAKAAGLATMIAAMRPDVDHVDEYVRNTTARALAVVASALGVPALLPFLKAVCRSKKSWQARHTGLKVVQQVAMLSGCGVLPHLAPLVATVVPGLTDEAAKVKTQAALAAAALAEAAAPYGIEAFDGALEPLWKGVRLQRGKPLAAFLKAIGSIIPLMDATYADYYTREVTPILLREFGSADEEMKKIVLKVVRQCVATDGVAPAFVRSDLLPDFFRCFWVRRMALDRRNYRALVDTTAALADRVGCAEVVGRIVEDLKDEAEPYRRMVLETVDRVVTSLGSADIDARLEELLVDGLLFAVQEQSPEATPAEAKVVLDGFATVLASLGGRAKPYLPQVAGTVKWRLNNKAAKVRQQAADLVARAAPVMAACGDDKLLGHLGVVLYECLGEEYPDVLGSVLGGLGAIVAVIGMDRCAPPIRDLLPRLTPILKNRHEAVQEHCVGLVGRIADRAPDQVPAREWMRICFELLELLKAPKLAIRRATVSTFGYIAKAIGPQDVLVTLLNNLKVQERQLRVCTTVAIAIVAEACAPFTVLPALMNEYRAPDLNVQNGVLKALAFLAEYIGPAGRDYVYAVAPLLADALADRDAVHRQTAATAVGHLALGVAGLGCEDAVLHLLNHVWPNILEPGPHLAAAVTTAFEGARLALGGPILLSYLLPGLFHPARRVRAAYWRLYNNLYVGCGPALVPAWPRLPDPEVDEDGKGGGREGLYARHDLDVFF